MLPTPSHRLAGAGPGQPLRWLVAVLLLATAASASAQDAPADGQDPAPDRPRAAARKKPPRKPRLGPDGHPDYQGRPIADVMSYLGVDWLFRPEREVEEQPEKMIDALGIQPGMTVADVGAGAGYTSMRLAQRVGPRGVVLATDVQPQMIAMLKTNLREQGITNVKPILCTQADPKLPEGQVDLILLVDVYHECSDPETALKGWRKALKPGGRIVFVEFRAEDPDVPIKPEHKMSVAQVRKEVEPMGFTLKERHDFLPWQHILIFEKPANEAAKPAAEPARAETPARKAG